MKFFLKSLLILYHVFTISFSCLAQCPLPGYILGNESWTTSASFNPANITNGQSATGGSGTISYKWQESTDLGATWTDIAGITSLTYNPNTITTTTWYRRLAKTGTCAWEPSNAVRKAIINTTTSNCPIQSTRTVGNISKCSGSGATKTALTISIEGTSPSNGNFQNYHHVIMPGTVMTEYCDGTAVISGQVCASSGRGNTPDNACFDFTYTLTGRTTTLPLGKSAVTGCDNNTNTSNWYYYSGGNDGTLLLTGVTGTDYEGAVIVIYGNQDHYFQVGDGAAYHIDAGVGAGIWGEPEILNKGISNIFFKNDGQDMDLQVSLSSRRISVVGDTICEGNNANILANTNCSGANYTWASSVNSFNSSIRNPTVNNSFLNLGLNYFYVTVTGTGNLCSATGTAPVLVHDSPNITINNNSPVCVGQAINLNSSASSQIYTFNSVSNQLVSSNESNFDNTCSGCFSSDVPTSARGYTTNPENVNSNWVNTGDHTSGSGQMLYFNDNSTASNRRQWYNNYTVSKNTNYQVSFWSRKVFSGGNNPTLFWTINNIQIDSFITLHYTNGWVYYEATWDSGSLSGAMPFAIVLYANDADNDFVIDDVSIVANSINVNVSNSTIGTYSWTGPASFSSTAQNPTRNNATAAMDGLYRVTVSNSNGCSATATTDVTVNNPPNAGIGTTTSICKADFGTNQTNLFSLLSGYSANTGTWQSISTPTSMNTSIINNRISSNNFLRNGLPVGTYVFRYTLTGNSPCPNDSEDVSVVIQPCCPAQFCIPMLSKKN